MMKTLAAIAEASGTDKGPVFHNYVAIYDGYLTPFRAAAPKFLEIGIYEGASVQMWEHYFTNGELHFIDNDPSIVTYHSDRSHYHFLDQGDRGALVEFAAAVGGNFDIIIDDGGHRIDQQMISFQMLFPHLKAGGLYIIEDIFTSYWQRYGGDGTPLEPASGPQTTLSFIKFLVDELNAIPAMTGCSDAVKTPTWVWQGLSFYQKALESIHFHRGLVIIEKSAAIPKYTEVDSKV